MKKNLVRVGVACMFSLCLFIAPACNNEEMSDHLSESMPEIVKVSLQINSGEQDTKIWYEQNGNQFIPIWSKGDQITVLTEDFNSKTDHVIPFEAQSTSTNPLIDGEIAAWEGEKTIYAIHPHRDDYYSFVDGKFIYRADQQVVDVDAAQDSKSQSVNNALFLAISENASFEEGEDGEKELNLNDLSFKQAMSFLRFEIGGLESIGCTLDNVRISTDKKELITKAEISIEKSDKGDVVVCNTIKASSKLTAIIKRHNSGDNAIINIALIPTTLTNPVLTIKGTTEDGKECKFVKQLPTLKFDRNNFMYFSKPLVVGSGSFDSERVY